MKNEEYSLNDYKSISMKFRDKSSNLLTTDHVDSELNLRRFKNFIDKTPIIKEIINAEIKYSDYDYKKEFFGVENGWKYFNIPENEADHIKAIYEYMLELCAKKDLDFISLTYLSYYVINENGYDNKIGIFIKKLFKPLIDFVISKLNERVLYMEKKSNSVVNNIGVNHGTVNTTNSGGIINSTQINNANEIDKLVKELKPIINDNQDLKSEDRENLIDDLEVVEEQINSEIPKRLRIKKAFTNIINFSKVLPEGLETGSNIFIKLQEFIDKSKSFFESL